MRSHIPQSLIQNVVGFLLHAGRPKLQERKLRKNMTSCERKAGDEARADTYCRRQGKTCFQGRVGVKVLESFDDARTWYMVLVVTKFEL